MKFCLCSNTWGTAFYVPPCHHHLYAFVLYSISQSLKSSCCQYLIIRHPFPLPRPSPPSPQTSRKGPRRAFASNQFLSASSHHPFIDHSLLQTSLAPLHPVPHRRTMCLVGNEGSIHNLSPPVLGGVNGRPFASQWAIHRSRRPFLLYMKPSLATTGSSDNRHNLRTPSFFLFFLFLPSNWFPQVLFHTLLPYCLSISFFYPHTAPYNNNYMTNDILDLPLFPPFLPPSLPPPLFALFSFP